MPSDAPRRHAVILERQAEKALRRLPRDVLRRVDTIILGLADDPRPAGCKKLVGSENLYRLRVGAWRVIYAVEDERLIVLVIDIEARNHAYRRLT
jgi:mRNA interferase RelE/StbE